MIDKIHKLSKKLFIIFPIVIVLIAAGLYFSMNKPKVEYTTVKVVRGNLVQTVSETGTVKAGKEINLSFAQGGKLAKLSAKVGDVVKPGDILAELDYSALNIKKSEVGASLDIARANLNKIMAGPTAKEIAVSQASVNQAKAAYTSAQSELEKTITVVNDKISTAEENLNKLESPDSSNITSYEQAIVQALTNLDNARSTYQSAIDSKKSSALTTIDDKISAAKTALDAVNRVLTDADSKDVFSVQNKSFGDVAQSSYKDALTLISGAQTDLSTAKLSKNENDIYTALNSADILLDGVLRTLNNCFSALENTITSAAFTQAELDAQKASINMQLVTIGSAISQIQTAKQGLEDAILAYKNNVKVAEENFDRANVDFRNATESASDNLYTTRVSGDQQISAAQSRVNAAKEAWDVSVAQLNNLKSPARSEDVNLAKAQVRQAEAALATINKQIDDSIIKSPIDGNIVKVEYEVGEQVAPGSLVISILSENNFDIEVDISEADIVKVQVNDPVTITLDALGEEIKFNGIISFIEPAETVIQDVIYYKVKITFADVEHKNTSVKPGMTANAIITTETKENVLLVPGRAVIDKGEEGKFTQVLSNNVAVDKKITVGLRGDEGMVEILSGLTEGEDVVTFTKEK